MNIIQLYNGVTDVNADTEIKLSNFLSGLEYSENVHYFSLILDSLNDNSAINYTNVLPSFRAKNVFTDADEYESTMKKLNIEISVSVGDLNDIADWCNKTKEITKLCSSITYNMYYLTFILK